jgi:GT2 family glycosyltransferase
VSLPPVSVVIVSRGRPDSLTWCLRGVMRLRYPAFEVVVVTDPEGGAAVAAAKLDDAVTLVPFDVANISAARNAGIGRAAGEIVAFIDDDAAPEPTWLSHLVAPFEDPQVAAVGGFVRGRNGISFQWKARQVDQAGRATPLEVDETRASLPQPEAGRAVKTEGTNMAVRRDVLAALGGFDPAYRFFLDETDLNLRLAAAGHVTAIAPLAQVHHAYAESPRRGPDRAVRDLREIGASTAVFLRRHCPEEDREARWIEVQQEQAARLVDQVHRRLIRKPDVGPLIAGLREGFAEGMARDLPPPARLSPPPDGFRPCPVREGGSAVLTGRIWQAGRLRREAAQRAAAGETVSLFLFSPGARFHRVRFTNEGYWEQVGGLFGRSDRGGPLVQPTTFARRVNREVRRVAAVRGLADMV